MVEQEGMNDLTAAFNHISIGLILIDDEMKIIDWNEQAKTLLSLPTNVNYWGEWLTADKYVALKEAMNQRLTHYSEFIVERDGQPVQLTYSLKPLPQRSRYMIELRELSSDGPMDYTFRLAAKVIENIHEGVLITNERQQILFVNPAFELVTHYRAEEVLGKTPGVLQSGFHDRQFYEQMWDEIRLTGSWKGEIWNRRKNGDVFPEWINISAIRNEHGEVTNYVSVFTDITERKKTENELRRLAHYDTLTGIPNRRLFQERLEDLLRTAKAHQLPFALLFLDLDRFKYVNDTLGHASGDELLRQVTRRINRTLANRDTIARLGGDEFVIAIPQFQHVRDVVYRAKKIIDEFKEPFIIHGTEIFVTTSIGISLFPYDGDTVDELLKNADRAMYLAKEKGRNNFELYHEELHQYDHYSVSLDRDLRKAIQLQQFTLHYQPIIEVKTMNIVGVEALLRWNHPERGLISPANFIPTAEETGLIVPISDCVLKQACHDLHVLQLNNRHIKMNINISGIYFQQEDFITRMRDITEQLNVDRRLIELELTESVIMPHAKQAIDRLVKLKQLGFKIAVDDFGTGYSSLSYLNRFPIDTLKMDRSFIANLVHYSEDASIVNAIIKMAHMLRLKVVAEGVETKRQLDYLQNEQSDYVQGYYFAKPMSIIDLLSFMDEYTQLNLKG